MLPCIEIRQSKKLLLSFSGNSSLSYRGGPKAPGHFFLAVPDSNCWDGLQNYKDHCTCTSLLSYKTYNAII
ncbi:hypothetical protein XELAEV_18010677mg [Xenopus laevis]|uniref:Uncharacterized protein n=1 Tax=Xenopus laevis TaxID=8355 RepID=A0A974DVT4_XENLA|nr:hypothetical protein XELAEV_18010677mg [Xenopus laevis]